MRVGELVGHILLHVNAEAAERDESQVGDVEARALYVREALEPLLGDTRELALASLLTLLSEAGPAGPLRRSFRQAVGRIADDAGSRPQLAIQDWVRAGLDG